MTSNQVWDLTELIDEPVEKNFVKRIDKIQKQAREFEKLKKVLRPNISEKTFYQIIRKLENLLEQVHTIYGFTSLSYSSDTQSSITTSRMIKMSQIAADISNKILFFDLWWKNLDKKNTNRLLKNSKNLENFLSHKKITAKYTLSEPEEKIINILDTTGSIALVKIYDKITSSFVYKIKLNNKLKKMTREEITNLYRSLKPDIRKLGYDTFFKRFNQDREILSDIYQNIVLNWNNEGITVRGHDSSISIRNIDNDIDNKTTTAVLDVCGDGAIVFQKFFNIKAKMLNMKKLRRFDIYAPAGIVKAKKYNFNEGSGIILEAFSTFSKNIQQNAKRVFTQNHINSEIRKGKRDGAFCSTISPKITPYILINYTKDVRSLFTLAHELGHAVHSMLASKQSILTQEAPLPIAETASTFSELILYDYLVEKISRHEQKIILAGKIDDLYATILRQSFFTLFEIKAHKIITQGATTEDISKMYLKNLNLQFGNSVNISKDFAIEWLGIPHFFHTPFYCYAYSFGNLLALSLFQRYKQEKNDFVPIYEKILAVGGSMKPEKLLGEYGFDITKKAFWQQGFDYINDQINLLSKL